MAETFNLKRGDTSPSLLYALDPASVDLTGATVRFNMRPTTGGVVKVSRAIATVVTETGTPTIRYDWTAQDTDTSGTYDGEFEVTYAGGAVETFPNTGFIKIVIAKDIA